MKKFVLLTTAIFLLFQPLFAKSTKPDDAFYQMLDRLSNEQKYPLYYAEAFMGLCNDWQNTKLMFYVADGYDKLGSLYREKNMLLRILKISPNDATAKKRLQEVQNRIDKIEKKIEEITSKETIDLPGYCKLSAIYIGLKDLSNARKYINKANSLDPYKKNIIHALMEGAYKKNLEYPTKKAIEISSDALIEFDKGHKEKAFNMFRDALALSIISPFVYDNLATAFIKDKNYGGAIRALEEVFAIRKEAATALDIGNLYFLLKNYTIAFDYFQQATKLNGGATEAYYNIALCLEKLGDKQGADEYFRIAYTQNPQLKKLKEKNVVYIKGIKIKINGEKTGEKK